MLAGLVLWLLNAYVAAVFLALWNVCSMYLEHSLLRQIWNRQPNLARQFHIKQPETQPESQPAIELQSQPLLQPQSLPEVVTQPKPPEERIQTQISAGVGLDKDKDKEVPLSDPHPTVAQVHKEASTSLEQGLVTAESHPLTQNGHGADGTGASEKQVTESPSAPGTVSTPTVDAQPEKVSDPLSEEKVLLLDSSESPRQKHSDSPSSVTALENALKDISTIHPESKGTVKIEIEKTTREKKKQIQGKSKTLTPDAATKSKSKLKNLFRLNSLPGTRGTPKNKTDKTDQEIAVNPDLDENLDQGEFDDQLCLSHPELAQVRLYNPTTSLDRPGEHRGSQSPTEPQPPRDTRSTLQVLREYARLLGALLRRMGPLLEAESAARERVARSALHDGHLLRHDHRRLHRVAGDACDRQQRRRWGVRVQRHRRHAPLPEAERARRHQGHRHDRARHRGLLPGALRRVCLSARQSVRPIPDWQGGSVSECRCSECRRWGCAKSATDYKFNNPYYTSYVTDYI